MVIDVVDRYVMVVPHWCIKYSGVTLAVAILHVVRSQLGNSPSHENCKEACHIPDCKWRIFQPNEFDLSLPLTAVERVHQLSAEMSSWIQFEPNLRIESLQALKSRRDVGDNTGATVRVSRSNLVPVPHLDVLQLNSLIERRNPSNGFSSAVELFDHVEIGRAFSFVDCNSTHAYQSALVALAAFAVVMRVLDDPVNHNPVSFIAPPVVLVNYLQRGTDPKLPASLVHERIFAFKVVRQIPELRFESDRVEMSETKAQSSTCRQEFRSLQQALKRFSKVGDVLRILSDGLSDRRGSGDCFWVHQIHVVGDGDSTAAGDLEDLVFDVTVERDVCKGRGILKNGQRFRVEFPFAILVTKHELSSLVGSGVDDHQRPEHIRSPRRIPVRLEERTLV